MIGRECFLGDECLLDLAEGIELEDQVTLAERVLVLTHLNVGYADHPLQAAFPAQAAPVRFERGSFVGAGATILAGVTVGREAFVAAGSVVTDRRGPAHPGGGISRAGGPRLLMADDAERGGRERALAVLVGVAALLPFARGLLLGHSFFFRDLSAYFFPLRLFLLQGLCEGELRYWNPFAHEGAPVTLSPLGYLPDLLQLLRPTEAGLSLVLALHFPLAAVGAFALARRLGAGLAGAAAAGLVYAQGGFALSTVNLYVYAQALAWAPFLILCLLRAARGGRRDTAVAALVTALALSTTGVEIVAQAIGAGLLLAFSRERAALLRLGLALGLGMGLAAAVTIPLGALLADSARGRGFATEVVVAHSVHPITWAQTLVAGLFADPSRFTDTFWGQNYFPRGFPYFLSLYLGALAVGLGLLGAASGSRTARLLAALLLLGILVSLGRYAGLESLVEAAPWVRRLRFPSKAFFSVHLAMALLAGLGLDTLVSGGAAARRRAGLVLLSLGALLAAVPWLALQHRGLRVYLLAGFFPPTSAPPPARPRPGRSRPTRDKGRSSPFAEGPWPCSRPAASSPRAERWRGWRFCSAPTWCGRGPASIPWFRRRSSRPPPNR